MSDANPPRAPERIDQLLFGALAGLAVAVVLQTLDKEPSLDFWLKAALICFAVALPVVVSCFLLEVAGAGGKKTTPRRLFDLAGVLLSLAGFVLLFLHIDTLAGGVFLASVGVCFVVVLFSLR